MESEAAKRIYNGYSAVYDALFKRFFYPRIRHAIGRMNIKPGSVVLDVGVGTGLSLDVFPRDCKVVGIDLSSEMLKKARQKVSDMGFKNVELFEMNAMHLAFPDDAFDNVFISHVVSVVPDPYKVISEVKRVCKKGGNIVIVNHFKSRHKIFAVFQKVFNPVSKMIGWRSDLCMDEFLAKSGLKVKSVYKLRKVDFWHLIFTVNEK
ncbi:MAG: methyltransferase domain-containing protein [Thermodesulfobacteriota bacterium]